MTTASEGAGTRWVGEDLLAPAPLLALPISGMDTLATAVFSDSMPPRRLEDLVSEIAPRPIMLIWTRNGMGGEANNPRYFDNAHEPKTIWEIEGEDMPTESARGLTSTNSAWLPSSIGL